MKFGVIEQNV